MISFWIFYLIRNGSSNNVSSKRDILPKNSRNKTVPTKEWEITSHKTAKNIFKGNNIDKFYAIQHIDVLHHTDIYTVNPPSLKSKSRTESFNIIDANDFYGIQQSKPKSSSGRKNDSSLIQPNKASTEFEKYLKESKVEYCATKKAPKQQSTSENNNANDSCGFQQSKSQRASSQSTDLKVDSSAAKESQKQKNKNNINDSSEIEQSEHPPQKAIQNNLFSPQLESITTEPPSEIIQHEPSKFQSITNSSPLPWYSDLSRDCGEYQHILKMITNRRIKVDGIKKIHNKYLEMAYELKKEEKHFRLGYVQEVLLFHGTKFEHVKDICTYNFDWRKVSRYKFGKGVSFSPNVTYASEYSDKDRNKVMIIAKVLIHNSIQGQSGMILPPYGYDTTQKDDGIVIVKYEDNEFYPCYLMYYHRK